MVRYVGFLGLPLKLQHLPLLTSKASLESLLDLNDAQLETTLLHSCLALPKVSYILRACPPSPLSQAVEVLDTLMRVTLETTTGAPLTDWSWLKVSLPSNLGSLSLRGAVLDAPPAFIALYVSSLPLVERILGSLLSPSLQMNTAVSALSTSEFCPDWSCIEEIDVPSHQKPLSWVIDEALYQQLLSSAPTIRSHALAVSCSLPHAGDWLNVVPSSAFGLHLHDKEFRSCLLSL